MSAGPCVSSTATGSSNSFRPGAIPYAFAALDKAASEGDLFLPIVLICLAMEPRRSEPRIVRSSSAGYASAASASKVSVRASRRA
jgi:hypothetical protein